MPNPMQIGKSVWVTAIGVGASVARVVAQRGAAKAWERATGDPPPIVT